MINIMYVGLLGGLESTGPMKLAHMSASVHTFQYYSTGDIIMCALLRHSTHRSQLLGSCFGEWGWGVKEVGYSLS